VNELRFARVHRPANRRGTGRLGRAGERDVTFAREQAGSRVEADPTGPGQKDFAPGVEIGKIDFRAGGAVQRFHVRFELNQITRNKTRRQAEMTEQMNEQPSRVAARTRPEPQCFLR